MSPEKTLNSQSNVEKENQSWRHHNSRLKAVLQSHNHHKVSMVLAHRHTDEQKRVQNSEMDHSYMAN